MELNEILLKSEVEKDFPKVLDVLKEKVPSLVEVRVCGSFIRDDWKPKNSDIDFFIETSDEFYSYSKDLQSTSFDLEIESKQRQELRQSILNNISSQYKNRFKFLIMSSNDVIRCWNYEERNKGPFGKNMKNGKPLFSVGELVK